MSRFYFGSDSDSDNDNADSLPFPAPLSREAFSADIDAPFSPIVFLATLRHRHQTLEDLRVELRTRSKDLEKELVELVNRDYADFIGLGSSLSGGDGRVEDLKMGLWGFQRDVEGVAGRIEEVAKQVERELKARENIRADKILARILLALSQRLDELSSLLLLDGSTPADSASLLIDGEGGEDVFGEGLTSIGRLKRVVSGYRYVIQHLVPRVPVENSFLEAQLPRIEKIKSTLLLDLRSALKESKLRDVEKAIVVMGFYADLGAEGDAVKLLREMKKEG